MEHQNTSTLSVRNMAKIAILAAAAAVVMLLEFPLVFVAPSFYKLDFSEVFVLLGGFAMGPVAGVVIELIKVLLFFLMRGTMTAGIGELSNFLVGCALVIPASLIYRSWKTLKSAVIGLLSGSLIMTALAAVMNYFVLIPAYVGIAGFPMDRILEAGSQVNAGITDLWSLILIATVPFNLIKTLGTSLIVILLYKQVEKILNRT